MKKWAIAALLYLLVVISGYTAYAEFFQKEENTVEQKHSEAGSHDTTTGSTENREHDDNGEEEEHGHEVGGTQTAEIKTEFVYSEGKVTITLTDVNGNPVDDLEVNHEKLLHLIVVDDHLDKYYHLHPEKVGEGEFELSYTLSAGAYKAFIDIKSKNLNYEVQPVAFHVGEQQQESHGHSSLTSDREFSKTIDGQTVHMEASGFESGKPVTLTFNLDESILEQYLGAAGHVVILDEEANEYLHVHPLDESKPIFETQFDKPGKYKIWAEFKQAGTVRVFPFVIEIK
jgi:hypothetical protein